MQRLLAVFAILLVSCVYAQNVGGTSGPCSAVAIPGPYNKTITFYGNNAGALSYSGGCFSSSSSGVVWYTITPAAGTNVTISSCNPGTNFDTVISIYNNTCSSLRCVAYNDDASCPGVSGRSTVSFISTGVTYYVGVSGYSSSTGQFQLTLNVTAGGNSGSSSACSSATVIYGPYSPPVSVYGTNNVSTGVVALANTTCQIYTYQFSKWFQIFPVVGLQVNVSTCNSYTNFDTVLTVAAGSNCSSLSCTGRNDDNCVAYRSTSSSLSFVATSSSYYVIVSGYSSAIGSFQLSVAQASNSTGGSTNPNCNSATSISLGSSTYGSTSGVSTSFTDPCGRYSTRPAVWYRLSTPTTAAVTLTTCNSYTNFDTVILVYSGSCSSLVCTAYNDDASCPGGSSTTSTLTFYPTVSSYYVVVAAYSSSSTGNFLLTVN